MSKKKQTKQTKPAAKPKAAGKKKSESKRKKPKSDVRKIYKTTDGYLAGNERSNKPRRVAVVKQRKDDGAMAVVKIYSKKDKSGKMYVDKLVLKPENHSSLTEDSIVGRRVYVGTKNKEGKYIPIFDRDLKATDDKLTKKEHRTVMKQAGGETKQNRKTNKKKLKAWKKHFK